MSDDLLARDHSDQERLQEGGTWLLDLVAAVDHLRRGIRPDLTAWDAIEEALRWYAAETGDDGLGPDWDNEDPLRGTLARLLDSTTGPVAADMQRAVRRWVIATADRCNNGHNWPHPEPRRLYPPPALGVDISDDDRT